MDINRTVEVVVAVIVLVVLMQTSEGWYHKSGRCVVGELTVPECVFRPVVTVRLLVITLFTQIGRSRLKLLLPRTPELRLGRM